MNLTQLQREGPRLVAMHSNLIKPGGGLMLWKKAQAERRFKQRHTFTLEADQRYVANLCLDTACALAHITRYAVLGERRLKPLKNVRHIAMTTAYELSGLSTIVLGTLFRRGHDMILHAQKRVNSDRTLRAQADKVVKAVKRELRRK